MSNLISLDEHMLISAVRYALGRATYIVGMTTEEVKRAWDSLTENTKFVIERDVRESHSYGMECDEIEWRSLLSFIDAAKTDTPA